MGGGFHGGFGADFYVGTNGQVLPGKYKKWIGVSRRDRFLKQIKNVKLENAVKQLYRPGSFLGDGGTASVLKFEKRTGVYVSRNPEGHYIKAKEMSKYIKNKVLSENLTGKERKIAVTIMKQMNRAILEWEGKI